MWQIFLIDDGLELRCSLIVAGEVFGFLGVVFLNPEARGGVEERVPASGDGGATDLSILTEKLRERLVCDRVYPHFSQLFLQLRVPVVLHVVVCSPWQPSGYQGPSVVLQKKCSVRNLVCVCT